MGKTIFDTMAPKMAARIQALRLMDDDFMTIVFGEDKNLTEFLLKILLSRDDLCVKSVMTQKKKRNLFGRSVRLDIVAEDTAGKIYNVEVQRADKGAVARRARYNLAMLDSHTLKKGEDFSALPETYIIFITGNDYYGRDKPLYTVRKIIDCADANGNDLPFDDGCYYTLIVYVYSYENSFIYCGSEQPFSEFFSGIKIRESVALQKMLADTKTLRIDDTSAFKKYEGTDYTKWDW